MIYNTVYNLLSAYLKKIKLMLNYKNIGEKNIKNLNLNNKDSKYFFINSWPRSGNTWLRLMLSEMISKKSKLTFSDKNKFSILKKIIPDISLDEIKFKNKVILKSHFSYNEFFTKFKEKTLNKTKFIYLYRDPLDALTSYYHYLDRYGKIKNNEDINLFCMRNIDDWNNHVISYLNKKNVLFICYNQLVRQTKKKLIEILDFLEIEHHKLDVQEIITNNNFKKLQNLEKKLFKNQKSLFFRIGKSGCGKKELSRKTIRYLNNKIIKTKKLVKEIIS